MAGRAPTTERTERTGALAKDANGFVAPRQRRPHRTQLPRNLERAVCGPLTDCAAPRSSRLRLRLRRVPAQPPLAPTPHPPPLSPPSPGLDRRQLHTETSIKPGCDSGPIAALAAATGGHPE